MLDFFKFCEKSKIKVPYTVALDRFGAETFLGNIFSQKSWQKNPQRISNIFKPSQIVDGKLFYPFSLANSFQKTPQMHLSTSPLCFEGTRGREIWFRDPGPEHDGLNHVLGAMFYVSARPSTNSNMSLG